METKESGFSNFWELLGGLSGVTGNMVDHQSPKGVYAEHPAASRKYVTYGRDTATQARLSIPLPRSETVQSIVATFNGPVREIAERIFTDSASYNLGYIDFLLQSAQEGFSEKVQIVDTLSDNYVAYFFGQNPPVFRYSGILFNTWQDDWRAAFTILYNEILRGTKLARKNLFATLSYDQQVVSGYIMDTTQTFSSDTQMASNFTFSLLVKRISTYRLPGTVLSTSESSQNVIAGEEFANILSVTPVKRTMRQVGNSISSSVGRAKPKDRTAPGVVTAFDATKDASTKQKEENIKDYSSLFYDQEMSTLSGSELEPLFP